MCRAVLYARPYTKGFERGKIGGHLGGQPGFPGSGEDRSGAVDHPGKSSPDHRGLPERGEQSSQLRGRAL